MSLGALMLLMLLFAGNVRQMGHAMARAVEPAEDSFSMLSQRKDKGVRFETLHTIYE